MRVKRKTVNQLLLSERELEMLFDLATKARNGQTVHYAETEVVPGQFFGVGVAEEHDSRNNMRMPPQSPKAPIR